MSSPSTAFSMLVLAAFILKAKPEEWISVDGLVPIDRCAHSSPNNEYFACKLDNCDGWIFFTNCPVNEESTKELNLVTRSLNCKKRSSSNVNNVNQGLFPKSMCKNNFTQVDVTWCEVEKCWFSFTGCGEDENPTEYLNFKEKTLVCQKKELTLNLGNYIVGLTEPTPKQQPSIAHSHSGQDQFKPVLSFFFFFYLLFFGLQLMEHY